MKDIFIQSINIEELRHLKNITIDMDDNEKKHLIITGKNGSGKSTVLEGMKKYLSSIQNKSYKVLLDGLKYKQKLKILDSEYTINIDNNVLKKERERVNNSFKSYESYFERYGNGLELNISNSNEVQNSYDEGKLVLAYFGAKRDTKVLVPTGIEKVKLDDKYQIESKPANQFLKYLVDLKTQQSFARNEEDYDEANKIELWFNNFENSLRNLMNEDELKLKFDYKNYNFNIIEKNKDPYGFNELSDGYSAVLDIIMDLIMRMEKKASRAYDLNGIVLIDEVETHLHIELQKNIMPFLTSSFPNIQFIVTTHSPFVLSSIDNAVIYDLEKRIKVEDLSAYSYEGIVESYFNVDQYSKEIKDKIDRYSYLVKKDNKTDEEDDEAYKLRKYLKNIPQDLAPELYGRFLDIEINRRTMI